MLITRSQFTPKELLKGIRRTQMGLSYPFDTLRQHITTQIINIKENLRIYSTRTAVPEALTINMLPLWPTTS